MENDSEIILSLTFMGATIVSLCIIEGLYFPYKEKQRKLQIEKYMNSYKVKSREILPRDFSLPYRNFSYVGIKKHNGSFMFHFIDPKGHEMFTERVLLRDPNRRHRNEYLNITDI